MKKTILLLLSILLSLVSAVTAQTNENQQRERDIKIAEGIIAEIFDSERSPTGTFPGFQERNVRGEYVPGYGVHFTVSPGHSNVVVFRNRRTENKEVQVEVKRNGDSAGSDSDSDEEIKEKIFEYMAKYGPLISGVADDESIRVTYAPGQSGTSVTRIFEQNGKQSENSQTGMSVWVNVSDLKQFKSGNISEQQLRGRINTHILDSDETYSDFIIFASVLETALNGTDAEHLRVSRKPQMEYLPGLGVRYRIQVSARPGFILNEIEIFDDNFEFRMDSLRLNLDESLKFMEKSLNPLILKLDSMMNLNMSAEEREQIQAELREEQREIRTHQDSLRSSMRPPAPPAPPARSDSMDLKPEAEAIMDQLLNVIENYGSTLSTLENDEMLMISVNWGGRSNGLPDRTEVRIKKSDLLSGGDPDVEEIKRR